MRNHAFYHSDTCTHTPMHAHTPHACARVCVYVCLMSVYVCVCVWSCVSVHVHVHVGILMHS